MKSEIPFGRPQLGDEEIAAALAVLRGTQLVHGAVCHAFEEKFAARIGARFATSVSSCTAGLHLALFTAGIGPGDEVVVPAMSHVATAHAVEYCGAKPLFVDVQPDTGNLDPDLLAAALSPTVKAVMVVHYLGLPADMDRVMAAANSVGAFVVEDCALAVDATYGGRKVGAFGRAGSFSFYPVKHMTTLEGGMVTTDIAEVHAAIAKQKAFGYDRTPAQRTKPGIYDVDALGFNYRMNELQAAIGLAQLDRLSEFQAARERNFATIGAQVGSLDRVTVLPARKGKAQSSHYCLNAVLPADGSIERDAVVGHLKAAGIGTSVHYPSALPMLSYYRNKYGYRAGQFPIAEWLAAQTISLPVGPHLDESDAERVGAAFVEAVRAVAGH
jgi:dTDP-4-amino-4,6-dideoxygalactose transaminase